MLFPGQRRVFGAVFGDFLDDVDQHRAGAAGAGDGKGFADDVGQLVHFPHEIGVFGDGHGDARDVDFLEGVAADEAAPHVAGDEHQRRGIHVGGGDAGGQVGAARAGGGEAHAHLAGGAGVTVGGVGRALFVGGQDVTDAVLIVVQLVIEIDDAAAGVAENGIYALLQQAFHQYLGAVHHHVDVLL